MERPLRLGTIALAYLAAHGLGYCFVSWAHWVSPVWPASGVGLAAMLLTPRSEWRATIGVLGAATLVSNLVLSRSLPMSLGFTASNLLEFWVGAWLVGLGSQAPSPLKRTSAVLRLALVATLWTAVPAVLGAATGSLGRGVPFGRNYVTWWFADALGILLVTPLILSWVRREPELRSVKRWEALALMAAWGLAAWLTFFTHLGGPLMPHPYMLLPLLAWTAIRAGERASTLVLVTLAAAAIVSSFRGGVALAPGLADSVDRLITTQLYLAIAALQSLLLAASTSEARLMERAAREDETRVRNAEAELSTSEALLRNFVRHAPAAVAMFDKEMRYLHVSQRWLSDYQLEGQDIIGRSHYEVFGDIPLRWKEVHGRVLAGAVERCDEDPFERANGSLEWLEWEVRPWRKASGEIGGLVMFTQLITERKHAKDAERRSEARFRSLIENTSDLITVLGPDGVIRFQSPSSQRLLGRTPEELLGMNVLELTHPDDLSAVRAVIAAFDSNPTTIKLRLRHRDGSYRLLECVGRRVPHEAAEGYSVVNSRDITDSTLLQEQLRRTQKLEALGTLAGGIAHDFNNILGAILAFTELAKLENPDRPALQEQLREITLAGQRATNLVRQILSFSRQQHQERKPIALTPVVAEALKLLRSTLPSTIDLVVSLPDAVPNVSADVTQIHQVVMNLCTNAAQAMNGRGRLSVSLDTLEHDASTPAHPVGLPSGRYLRLLVADTGHGMDAATVERIFEPFFTTKQPGEGTGLGLAVVHGIVKDHEGGIGVASQPGRGTTFTILLPAAASREIATERQSAEAPAGHGQKVMFVDDERALCDVAGHILKRAGYVAVSHRDSSEAWHDLELDPDGYALVVTDLTMPGMTGLDLAAKIHGLRPALPIILTSGHPGELSSEVLESLGVRELLQKPIDYAVLTQAVARAMQPFASRAPALAAH
jgi:PAS domain S-box-containing protein